MRDALTKVLVVDDEKEEFLYIRDIFRSQQMLSPELFYLEYVPTYDEALQRIALDRWNLAMVDYNFNDPANPLTGVDLIHRLRRQGLKIPMLLMSDAPSLTLDPESLLMIQSGELRFIPKQDMDWSAVYKSIRDFLSKQFRVLIVDDDSDDAEIAARYLGDFNQVRFEAARSCTLEQALARLTCETFDAVVLDYHLGSEKGTDLLPHLHALPHKPKVVLCSNGDHTDFDESSQTMIWQGDLRFLPKQDLNMATLVTQLLAPVHTPGTTH